MLHQQLAPVASPRQFSTGGGGPIAKLGQRKATQDSAKLAIIAFLKNQPCCSRKRWASSAAMQPVPALVMAWRYTWSWQSPAAKTPGTLVWVAKPYKPPWVTM